MAVKPSVLAVCFYSSPGPVADNFYTMCRAFAGMTQLTVLTSGLMRARDIPGATIHYFDFSKHRLGSWIWPDQWIRLVAGARNRPYDLLFLYSEHPLHAAIAGLARARRSVFYCLDPTPHSGARPVNAMFYELARRSLMRSVDRVAVACEALKQDVVSRYHVAAERVLPIFHGVLENLVFPELRHGVARDIDILFFGRLEAYKGVDVLLEATRLVRARGRTFKTVVAGTGPFAVPPAEGVTVENRYLEDRELAFLVARARIVVMPYRDATGSQVPQTAFSYGTPVVASSVGCLSEYIEDGVTGLLVPAGDPGRLADAIERLLTDTALWQSMSGNARKQASTRFDNEALVATLLEGALGK